ncbi:MAG TPA: thiamine phosphate synthase [Pirellulales bacterium]|nr:thiamine phosphate synthase [Pirellulales bacterium]
MPNTAPTNPHPPNPGTQSGILRIVDAESNRTAEGLRVVEDYVRFVLNDQHLTRLVKQLRHDLAAALQRIPTANRLSARESQADVGAELSAAVQSNRTQLADVVAASFKRIQQGLRSLEEYVKLLHPAAAAELESLRFRSYTLERAVGITANSCSRLAETRLYVLIDGGPNETAFAALAQSLTAAGVHALQLRDKQLTDRELLARARSLRDLTRTTPTLFIMNDRADLAVLAGADGVHVGQDELSVKDARAIVGPQALIGVSTHSLEQARQAVLDGASYIGVGPTFPSTTKSFSAFTGINLLHSVAAEISLPAFAIGGITLENIPQVISSGLHRVAVSASITAAPDPTAATRAMLSYLAPGESPGAKLSPSPTGRGPG